MKAFILSILLLTGCAATPEPQIIYKDRIVEVPTIVMEQCPPLPIVLPMKFATDDLTKESSNQDIARAYVKDRETCKIKVEQYKEALEVSND